MEKITYASLGSLGESFHQEFEAALNRVRQGLGRNHPLYINGRPKSARREFFDDTSPADQRVVLGRFVRGHREDARQAIAAAQAAFPAWRRVPWTERLARLRRAAAIMTARQFDLAALMSLEVGKNRFESIAEVSESVDLILYYCQQMEDHGGYEMPMGGVGAERTRSVLKPHGVWAVVAPFNFPLALATGMAAAALIAGNTVVFKPATDTPWSGFGLCEIMREAGLPPGVFNFLTGPGATVGAELMDHPSVDGFVFTGSRAVGVRILRRFTRKRLRPCIAEMGGKNAAIIMPSANLEDAAEGVLRSAFGMGGQKCSACSRLYLHRAIARPFLDLFLEKTRRIQIGDPVERATFLGPLINAQAVGKYRRAVALGRREGRVLHGGNILADEPFAHGFFVEPTVIDRLPKTSVAFQEEYFAPVLAVAEIRNLEEAIQQANASEYGLTAGIFTRDDQERERFFEEIEAGVAYCNRRGGATTGAWPGIQSFGGWKHSGSSGKNALGPYYVAQFMREQSQTRVGGG